MRNTPDSWWCTLSSTCSVLTWHSAVAHLTRGARMAWGSFSPCWSKWVTNALQMNNTTWTRRGDCRCFTSPDGSHASIPGSGEPGCHRWLLKHSHRVRTRRTIDASVPLSVKTSKTWSVRKTTRNENLKHYFWIWRSHQARLLVAAKHEVSTLLRAADLHLRKPPTTTPRSNKAWSRCFSALLAGLRSVRCYELLTYNGREDLPCCVTNGYGGSGSGVLETEVMFALHFNSLDPCLSRLTMRISVLGYLDACRYRARSV